MKYFDKIRWKFTSEKFKFAMYQMNRAIAFAAIIIRWYNIGIYFTAAFYDWIVIIIDDLILISD